MAVNATISDVAAAQKTVQDLKNATAEFAGLVSACQTCANTCMELKGTITLNESVANLMEDLVPKFKDMVTSMEEANKVLEGWVKGAATIEQNRAPRI